MSTWIYNIHWTNEMTAEDCSAFFADANIEGIEENEDNIKVYVAEENKHELEDLLNELKENLPISYATEPLEDKNWNEQWESSFQPILIDDFVYVRATFHASNKEVQHEIIIEPKMSFGTGHHPTTSQMMQNMRRIDFQGKTVLDCGSGTGILAILAEKLGASHAIALDNDTWCYENCRESITLNGCQHIQPEIGELEKVTGNTFDIILANIHRNFLTEHMHTLAALLVPAGTIIVSGFYTEDEKVILEKALEHHLIAQYRTSMHNWDCIVLQKK